MTLTNGFVLPIGEMITDDMLTKHLASNPRVNVERRKEQLIRHAFIEEVEDDKGNIVSKPTVQTGDPLAEIERKGRWYYPKGSDKGLTRSKALEFIKK